MIIFMLIFLSTGLRLYIGNLPSHMDEVLVQTTKSRRIRMVERKTRKRSVDKPKTKHLEARHTMDSKEKKKRSVTLIRDHSKEYLSNLTVEFDQFDRAIGPNRFKFTSYHGVTTRKMISILIDSWDLVDQCDKDQLWLNIKNYWHIRDDNHKAQVLRDCNTQWKAYKSALLKLWEKGVNPVKEYPYLDKAMWKKFIVLKSTEEFEVEHHQFQLRIYRALHQNNLIIHFHQTSIQSSQLLL
ncbi:uncharacterized protein LOC111921450 [Lactuca sativa]|uniref:uncharacterized protein LOC122196521 n=1 Tax=Lactuca sativa TaxID=4236 RepID=UPI001C687C6D|nr:uncharacterized protein LOC122196521 [Lactuca sativa]XP_042756155.1 uncharacterized protein LOC111920311 [Lactuca sativa]XP_042756209.1 uncharacterized protein LOC111909840 [Lactuca sativa]XP_042758099.1 uncharacterized protein LOC111921450 [Lactuca sativa]